MSRRPRRGWAEPRKTTLADRVNVCLLAATWALFLLAVLSRILR